MSVLPRLLACVGIAFVLDAQQSLGGDFLEGNPLNYVLVAGDSLDDEVGRSFDVIVGPGPEVTSEFSIAEVDISDFHVAIRFDNPTGFAANRLFNGPKITDTMDAIPPFGNVVVDEANSSALFATSRIAFNSDLLFLDLGGLAFPAGHQIALYIAPVSPGDANGDGKVNSQDLNALGLNWQLEGKVWSEGDFNNDGKVNSSDLNLLALHWQDGVIETRVSAIVPEPGAGALLLMLTLSSALIRRIL